jgi:hypothetical protein
VLEHLYEACSSLEQGGVTYHDSNETELLQFVVSPSLRQFVPFFLVLGVQQAVDCAVSVGGAEERRHGASGGAMLLGLFDFGKMFEFERTCVLRVDMLGTSKSEAPH